MAGLRFGEWSTEGRTESVKSKASKMNHKQQETSTPHDNPIYPDRYRPTLLPSDTFDQSRDFQTTHYSGFANGHQSADGRSDHRQAHFSRPPQINSRATNQAKSSGNASSLAERPPEETACPVWADNDPNLNFDGLKFIPGGSSAARGVSKKRGRVHVGRKDERNLQMVAREAENERMGRRRDSRTENHAQEPLVHEKHRVPQPMTPSARRESSADPTTVLCTPSAPQARDRPPFLKGIDSARTPVSHVDPRAAATSGYERRNSESSAQNSHSQDANDQEGSSAQESVRDRQSVGSQLTSGAQSSTPAFDSPTLTDQSQPSPTSDKSLQASQRQESRIAFQDAAQEAGQRVDTSHQAASTHLEARETGSHADGGATTTVPRSTNLDHAQVRTVGQQKDQNDGAEVSHRPPPQRQPKSTAARNSVDRSANDSSRVAPTRIVQNTGHPADPAGRSAVSTQAHTPDASSQARAQRNPGSSTSSNRRASVEAMSQPVTMIDEKFFIARTQGGDRHWRRSPLENQEWSARLTRRDLLATIHGIIGHDTKITSVCPGLSTSVMATWKEQDLSTEFLNQVRKGLYRTQRRIQGEPDVDEEPGDSRKPRDGETERLQRELEHVREELQKANRDHEDARRVKADATNKIKLAKKLCDSLEEKRAALEESMALLQG